MWCGVVWPHVPEVPQAIYICCDHGLDQATLPEEVARTALCFVHDSPSYRNAGAFGGLDADAPNDVRCRFLCALARARAARALYLTCRTCRSIMAQQRGPRRLCLPARQVVAHPPCEDDTDCGESTSPASAADDGNASDGDVAQRICLRPAASDLAERLIRIRVAGQPTVLYVGHPANLLSTGRRSRQPPLPPSFCAHRRACGDVLQSPCKTCARASPGCRCTCRLSWSASSGRCRTHPFSPPSAGPAPSDSSSRTRSRSRARCTCSTWCRRTIWTGSGPRSP